MWPVWSVALFLCILTRGFCPGVLCKTVLSVLPRAFRISQYILHCRIPFAGVALIHSYYKTLYSLFDLLCDCSNNLAYGLVDLDHSWPLLR